MELRSRHRPEMIILTSQRFSMFKFVPLINLENYLNYPCILSIFVEFVRFLQDAKTGRSQERNGKNNVPRVSRKLAKDGTYILFGNFLNIDGRSRLHDSWLRAKLPRWEVLRHIEIWKVTEDQVGVKCSESGAACHRSKVGKDGEDWHWL